MLKACFILAAYSSSETLGFFQLDFSFLVDCERLASIFILTFFFSVEL